MATKDNLKSARKIFMVNRVKTSILSMHGAKDDEVEEKLAEILVPLQQTFGEDEGLDILEKSIIAADKVITDSIAASVVEQVNKSKNG